MPKKLTTLQFPVDPKILKMSDKLARLLEEEFLPGMEIKIAKYKAVEVALRQALRSRGHEVK